MFLLKQENEHSLLELHFVLINATQQTFNLHEIALALKKQIEYAYTIPRFGLTCFATIKVLYQYNLKQLYLYPTIAMCNSVTNNNVAESHFTGLLMKINKNFIADIISHKNKRTVPHEVGHLLGLDHPHANATFESVNFNAHILEQQITEADKKHNLMCQSWYIQKHGVTLNDAIQLAPQQIQLIFENLTKNKLHNNYFILKKWWGYKLVTKL